MVYSGGKLLLNHLQGRFHIIVIHTPDTKAASALKRQTVAFISVVHIPANQNRHGRTQNAGAGTDRRMVIARTELYFISAKFVFGIFTAHCPFLMQRSTHNSFSVDGAEFFKRAVRTRVQYDFLVHTGDYFSCRPNCDPNRVRIQKRMVDPLICFIDFGTQTSFIAFSQKLNQLRIHGRTPVYLHGSHILLPHSSMEDAGANIYCIDFSFEEILLIHD